MHLCEDCHAVDVDARSESMTRFARSLLAGIFIGLCMLPLFAMLFDELDGTRLSPEVEAVFAFSTVLRRSRGVVSSRAPSEFCSVGFLLCFSFLAILAL